MTPSAALHDPVFRVYLVVVLVLLLAAGIVLALLRSISRIETGVVWKTYYSWLWMAPLAALAIFAGRAPFIAGVILLAVLAWNEFARVAGLKRDRWIIGAIRAGIVAVGTAALLKAGIVFVPILALGFILLVPVFRNRREEDELRRMSLGMIAFIYLGWMFQHLGFLANTGNAYGYLCYILFATEVTDVASFTFGKMFGRHPLRSAISPRKTWEGAFGGLGVALALPWLLHFSFPFFDTPQLILTGLIVGIGAPLGDLSLSLVKRELGAKDWGAAIPGHGGVLDRIDSLIFVAPLFMQMAEYYYPGR